MVRFPGEHQGALPRKKVNACWAGKDPPRKGAVKLEEVLKRVFDTMVREDGKPKKTKPGHCLGYAEAE